MGRREHEELLSARDGDLQRTHGYKVLEPAPALSAAAAAGRPKKLGVGHFAFMRALVQRVDARASWERYLPLEGEATRKLYIACAATGTSQPRS